MGERRNELLAAGLAFGAALVTALPYLLAQRIAPEPLLFAGFLVNPLDGFSYLAKMRQGLDGAWLFQLPYTTEPGPPAFIFTFYLALGHLARLTGSSLILIFHLARMTAAVAMGLSAYFFLRLVLPVGGGRWLAYGLFLFGSGAGWLAAPLGLVPSDLLIPESIPFFAAFVNPHFPLAIAAVAVLVSLALTGGPAWRQWVAGAGVGMLLAIVLPFAVVVVLAVLAVWVGWEVLEGTKGAGLVEHSGPLTLALGAALGSGPVLLYDFLLTVRHPVLALWNQQNQTPSPPVWSYAAGYGLVLLFALLGMVRERPWQQRAGRLLTSWVVVNALLLYAPFHLQRRLALGLFLPLAALAAMGIRSVLSARPGWRWLPALVLVLAVPSNLLAMTAGLVEVGAGAATLLLTPGERRGYEWIHENLEGTKILAAPQTGNRLPAYAQVDVYYGHPFETPRAEEWQAKIERTYRSLGEGGDGARTAGALGAEYLIVGPHELELMAGSGRLDLPLRHDVGEFQIYEVPPQ